VDGYASLVGHPLLLLFLPVTILLTADHDPEAGLLEYDSVVVVGVAHGPPALVAGGILGGRGVDELYVAVRPVLEVIHHVYLYS